MRDSNPVIVTRPQDREIRLRLRVPVQPHRVADRHDGTITNGQNQQASESIAGGGMLAADRTHRDQLPLDQLDPGGLGQNPRLAHAVILVDRQQAARRVRET